MMQFNELHQEAFGTDVSPGGYPDTGNGIYAEKLNYKESESKGVDITGKSGKRGYNIMVELLDLLLKHA